MNYTGILRTLALTACILSVLVFAITRPIFYSGSHTDYRQLKSDIWNFSASSPLDLTALNGGRWRTACLFGGYSSPSEDMRKFGRLSFFDRIYQPMKSWIPFRIGEVAEHEVVLAFVDWRGRVEFIHFDTVTAEGSLEDFKGCVSRDYPFIRYE
ncbi:MAG: hypothetical protein ABJN26_13220 [Stappiaceae bacterium]